MKCTCSCTKSLPNFRNMIIAYLYILYLLCLFWEACSSFFWRFIQSVHLSITKVLLLRGPLLDSCLSRTNHAIKPTSKSFKSWRLQGQLECWSEFATHLSETELKYYVFNKNMLESNLLNKVLIVLFHQLNAVLFDTLINKVNIHAVG